VSRGRLGACHKPTHAPQRSPCLFDHLIGAGEQRGRHGKAKRPGGSEIDHQLDLGRLLDWQVRWLLAFQDATGIDARLALRIGNAAAIAD
jgi:hypothetical protein